MITSIFVPWASSHTSSGERCLIGIFLRVQIPKLRRWFFWMSRGGKFMGDDMQYQKVGLGSRISLDPKGISTVIQLPSSHKP